jgi:hypothetical protein
MIDFHYAKQTIRSIGREDRAMLGSNPSARTMAGHQQEHLRLTRCSCSSEFQLMFCPQSDKPMPSERYKISKNYEEPRSVCHLARSAGRHIHAQVSLLTELATFFAGAINISRCWRFPIAIPTKSDTVSNFPSYLKSNILLLVTQRRQRVCPRRASRRKVICSERYAR